MTGPIPPVGGQDGDGADGDPVVGGEPPAGEVCFRCGRPATRLCVQCGQPYCHQHGTDVCSECAANLTTERALSVSLGGCLLGLGVGLVVVVIVALAVPGAIPGRGVGIGLILASGAAFAVLTYAIQIGERR